MTRKRSNNKFIEIKPDFESILVCGNKNQESCPFVQILVQEPENIDCQNLGTLIGVFEVTDESEESSYIVNYLVSIIKKEYFSKPKRGPVESLEASLHKANLALSNLVEHGSIGWLGKLNVLVAVTEKNGLHLSQAGNASAFLLRSKILTDISEGLSMNESEPNPLKTFINVSSGRMEKDDKLIITTPSIFDIFSLEEIKKSSLRFSRKEFVQFLRTALGNELEKAAVLVVDFDEKEIPIKKILPKKDAEKPFNAFSSQTFKEKPVTKAHDAVKIEEESLKEEIKKAQSEFVDEKTGHIYIKEDLYGNEKFEDENSLQINEIFGNIFKAIGRLAANFFSAAKSALGSSIQKGKTYLEQRPKKEKFSYSENPVPSLNIPTSEPDEKVKINPAYQPSILDRSKEIFISIVKNSSESIKKGIAKIIPRFEKIRIITSKLDYSQKLYGILILILIFIVPIYIARFLNNMDNQESIQPAPEVANVDSFSLEKDKNIKKIDNINASFSTDNSIIDIIRLNEKTYVITSKEIVDTEKNLKFPFPQDFGDLAYAREMDDLNLIFLINKNKRIISFSPTSRNFQENSINIPGNAQISGMGTYLTYLYLVDTKNNQIYRYPRAEGGFGEKTDWIKESLDLNNILDFSINESVFIAKSDSISKVLRGKKDPFQIESTATKIDISKISLGKESGNILILDKNNSRLVYCSQNGQILGQYYNPEIQKASDIALDEKNNLIYLSVDKSLESININ